MDSNIMSAFSGGGGGGASTNRVNISDITDEDTTSSTTFVDIGSPFTSSDESGGSLFGTVNLQLEAQAVTQSIYFGIEVAGSLTQNCRNTCIAGEVNCVSLSFVGETNGDVYQAQWRTSTGTARVYNNTTGNMSYIVAMEVY